MYTAYYELRQEPFHVTPDPEFLFPSPAHKEALAAIIYGIEQRKGFVAITGEVGVGKTTILRSYLDFADRQSLKLIYIYNSNLTFDELVTTVLQELGVAERPPSAFQAVTRLHEELIEVYRKNQTVVLIIDEAQNMPVETLESLRMLSNLETVTEKLIQIMLIGQPELDELLQQHRLRQLRQRIAIHARIDPLNIEDSIAYLEHRLAKVALGTKPVFTKNALRLIAESSQGIPRNLNIVSDNALITGFGSQVRPVNTRIVKEVLADRGVAPPEGLVRRWRGAWAGGAAAAAAILITIAVLALQPNILSRGGPVLQSDLPPGRAAPPEASSRPVARPSPSIEDRASGVASAPAPPEPGSTRASTELAIPRPQPEPQVAPADETGPARPPEVVAPAAPAVPPPARSPDVARAEPQPAPRPTPPAPAPVRSPEIARAEPQAQPSVRPQAPVPAPARSPQASRSEPPAPPRPVTAPPAASPSSPAAEPARPERSGTAEAGANEAGPGSAASARRSAPIPLLPPPARAPAPPASRQAPAPSVAAAPPPAAAVAVPSIMLPSASGSGTVASLPQPTESSPGRAAAPARPDPFVRTVRAGDSLWTMAEDVYGFVNPNVLRRVQDANPQLRNINILSPGQEIVFPRVPEASLDRGATQAESITGGN
jgi:general secretion pathway protein A